MNTEREKLKDVFTSLVFTAMHVLKWQAQDEGCTSKKKKRLSKCFKLRETTKINYKYIS